MRVTLLSSNYYYLYMFGVFFQTEDASPSFPGFPLNIKTDLSRLESLAFPFALLNKIRLSDDVSGLFDGPKSCLFALLLVYKHSCSSTQGLPTFVHSFFCTWCNTQTFYVSEKRQLSVRIQGVLFWVFAFFFCHIEFEWICPLRLLVSSSSGTVCLLMWTVSHMSCLQLSERTSSMSVLLPWSF